MTEPEHKDKANHKITASCDADTLEVAILKHIYKASTSDVGSDNLVIVEPES